MRLFNIRGTIKNISESADKETALKHENAFYSILLFISLLYGSIANIFVQYVYLKEPLDIVIKNTLILIVFAILALFISVLKNEILKMYLYSIEVSLVFLFTYYVFYSSVGPSIISIGLLFLITMLIYSRIEIIILYFSSMVLITTVFNKYLSTFTNWNAYFISQIVILVMILIATLFVYSVYKSRQNKIMLQYNEIFLAKEKLYATLIAVGEGVIAVDKNGFIDYMNPVAEKLTGWIYGDSKELHFEKIFKMYNKETKQKIDNPVQTVLELKKIVKLTDNILLMSKDGSNRLIENIASPIKDETGDILGVVLVFRDVTKQRERRNQIENLSYCDHLTGLFNRRYFEESINKLDIESNLPLSFVFADVNGLKTINDVFGHDIGDKLIKTVAKNIKDGCRSEDIVSRIGGDEFVMILPRTDSLMADDIVKRIIKKLDNEKIMNIDISVAFGIGTKENKDESSTEILVQAEEFMYKKKISVKSNKRSAVINSIYKTLMSKSKKEAKHSNQVSLICEIMGKILKMDEYEVKELKTAGKFHDIGKIAIDESILSKSGKLTETQWHSMKQHTEIGYRLLGTSSEYYNISNFVRSHHEKWDGTGYPRNLKGEEIPIESRIIAIVDAYDRMISEKNDGKVLSLDEVIDEFKNKSGTYFDPKLVKIFIEEYLLKKEN